MASKKLPYPRSIVFILVHQIFERFAFWGIVVALPLFLRNVLNFDDDSATATYHGFTIFGYISSLVGAIVADAFWGKFRTIIGFSFVYFVGTFCLSASAAPLLTDDFKLAVAITGLVLTALSSGSIKPCIIAYGGDQFCLPQQQKELDAYFPMLYLVINFSLFFTAIITPILRKDASCFGDQTCHSLAFFVPFVFVVIAFVIFLLGKARYVNTKVDENVVGKSVQCIKTAILEKFKNSSRKKHWLDYADSKFEKEFIQDVKTVLNLLVLFLPVTMFWALFDQQFSRWTFQATRMDDKIFGYAIKPDQFATLNFILTFLFIPLFEKAVFPVLAKFNLLKKPLQKVVTGALFASLAFVICGCLELQIESSVQPLPSNMESQLNVMNTLECVITVDISDDRNDHHLWRGVSKRIAPSDNYVFKAIPSGTVFLIIKEAGSIYNPDRNICGNVTSLITEIELLRSQAHSLLAYSSPGDSKSMQTFFTSQPDDLSKSLESNSKLRLIYGGLDFKNNRSGLILLETKENLPAYTFDLNSDGGASPVFEVTPKKYTVKLQNANKLEDLGSIEPFIGGSYILSITGNKSLESGSSDHNHGLNIYTITDPNSVHIIWLLPQYIIMSVAEVMVEISLTGFAYSQAPDSMKSLLQVVNLIPPALGGIVVVVLAESKLFEQQSMEFFVFAVINFGAVVVLICLAKRYKPIIKSDQLKECSTPYLGDDNQGFQKP